MASHSHDAALLGACVLALVAGTQPAVSPNVVGGGVLLVGIQPAGKGLLDSALDEGGEEAAGYKFELVELDPLSGAALAHPLNGTVHCGKGCSGCDATPNSANADVIPAGSSSIFGGSASLLLFTVQCICPIEIGPNNWLEAKAPPTLVAVDVAQLQLAQLQTLPAVEFNVAGLSFSASGWNSKAKRAVVIGPHAQNGTSPFTNTTMVFASVNLGSGLASLANGTTQCGSLQYAVPGCEGNIPVEAVGTMDGGTWIGEMNFVQGHRMGFPGSLIGTDVATGATTINTSFAVPFYTMARSPTSDDIVGLGLCCDTSRFPSVCPAECGTSAGTNIRTLALLRWGADRKQAPKIVKTFLSDVLGLQFVSAAGGALSSKGTYTHLGYLKTSPSADWGGLAPASLRHRRMQPTPTGGQALFTFDVETGQLLQKVPLQGDAVKDLAFLRYV